MSRHSASRRNRMKALKMARDLGDVLEEVDRTLRRVREVEIRYVLGRAARLIHRLEAEARR